MRRSKAPSNVGEEFNRPLSNSILIGGRNKPDFQSVPVPIESAARSTKSILGLIANVNQISDTGSFGNATKQLNEVAEPLKELTVLNEDDSVHQNAETPINVKRFFSVVYGKPSKKKHKTWEGDGLLEIDEKSLILKDTEGNIIGRGCGKKNSELNEGSRVFVGNKEVEIVDLIPENTVASTKQHIESETPQHPTVKKPKVSGNLRRSTSFCHDYAHLTMPQPDIDHQVP